MHAPAHLVVSLVLALSFIPMSGTPATAWQTAGCRSSSLSIRNRPPHKAVVSSSHLDYEHCFGVWSQPSKDAAIKRALDACKREGGMTGCVVVWAE